MAIDLDTNVSRAKTGKPSVSKTEEKNAVSEILNRPKAVSGAPGVWVPGNFIRGQITADYNEINILETESAKIAKLEMWIAKNIGEELMAKYPGREWGVNVNTKGEMIYVMCPSLSTTKAYYIRMAGRNMLELKAEAIRAAGEILERHGISRARRIDSEIFEHLERDLRDDVISPDAAPGREVKGLEV